MPWKVSNVLDQRIRFVHEYESGEWSLAELCRRYEISRESGYKWVKRYQAEGIEGLVDQSRAPARHPNQTPAEIEARVLELRRLHPRWGARKLRAYLQRRVGTIEWPAASTIGEMLKREGLTIPRKKRRRTPPYREPFAAAEGANCVWCADFKGWFRTQDGARIDPLTMIDAYSRYLIRCQAVEKGDTEQVRAIFEAAFREYGMPWVMHTDNGPPFASRAIAGLSELSVWLMKLGIRPERSEAGHPEQNGRQERMHETLKQETASPPEANRRAQQRAFDRFLREYNEERPHEALENRTPAEFYTASARPYPERTPEPEYAQGMPVRRVQAWGQIYWKHQPVFLSETLIGERVGLEPIDDRYWLVYFAEFPIGRFDSKELRMGRMAKERQAKAGCGNDGAVESAETQNQGSRPSPSPLEISPNPRDSHISTASTTAVLSLFHEEEQQEPRAQVSTMCPV